MTDDLGKALQDAADAWQAQLRETLTVHSAAGTGGALLAHIDAEGVSQGLLADRMGFSKQAVQQVLDHLEAAGLVRRESDPDDRRAKRILITEAGTKALADRRAAEAMLAERVRTQLGKKRFKQLRKALKALPAA